MKAQQGSPSPMTIYFWATTPGWRWSLWLRTHLTLFCTTPGLCWSFWLRTHLTLCQKNLVRHSPTEVLPTLSPEVFDHHEITWAQTVLSSISQVRQRRLHLRKESLENTVKGDTKLNHVFLHSLQGQPVLGERCICHSHRTASQHLVWRETSYSMESAKGKRQSI